MDWVSGAVQAIVALDNAGKAWVFAIVMASGSLVSLVVAWRMGYFRSHHDIVRQQRAVAKEVAAVRRDVSKIEDDLKTLHGQLDVLTVDQAGFRPILEELQTQVGQMSRTVQRLGSEVARMGGATDTMLQMLRHEPTPPDGSRPLGQLEETPDPDRRDGGN